MKLFALLDRLCHDEVAPLVQLTHSHQCMMSCYLDG